jgi:hypothetical protein
MNVLEIVIEGSLYRCYPTLREESDPAEKYIVAGVGSITLTRESGAIVTLAPIFTNGGPTLKKLAPLIHGAAQAMPIAC